MKIFLGLSGLNSLNGLSRVVGFRAQGTTSEVELWLLIFLC